jgi:hypothetical protein
VRTSRQKKTGESRSAESADSQSETEIGASFRLNSEAGAATAVVDVEKDEPLYPPILQSSSSMFPAVPPIGFGDMSFDPETAKDDIDENVALSSADQEFVDYITTLLHAKRI